MGHICNFPGSSTWSKYFIAELKNGARVGEAHSLLVNLLVGYLGGGEIFGFLPFYPRGPKSTRDHHHRTRRAQAVEKVVPWIPRAQKTKKWEQF